MRVGSVRVGKFYFNFLNQSSRALYILLEASKIPFEAIPISILKGKQNLLSSYNTKYFHTLIFEVNNTSIM